MLVMPDSNLLVRCLSLVNEKNIIAWGDLLSDQLDFSTAINQQVSDFFFFGESLTNDRYFVLISWY